MAVDLVIIDHMNGNLSVAQKYTKNENKVLGTEVLINVI